MAAFTIQSTLRPRQSLTFAELAPGDAFISEFGERLVKVDDHRAYSGYFEVFMEGSYTVTRPPVVEAR